MELMDAAISLQRYGALLGIVLGLISVIFWGYIVFIGMSPPFFVVNIYEIFLLVISFLAMIFSYVVLTRFPQRVEEDPSRNALFLIGIGFIIAFGAWGIAGLLIVLSAVLILMDETS